ncbi:hypothetical protein BSKO_04218 [Bryopsis sp. KO-2023]|nr:hypothetical protein BSKO_04218 [Bryopsis sp. KO-2023]
MARLQAALLFAAVATVVIGIAAGQDEPYSSVEVSLSERVSTGLEKNFLAKRRSEDAFDGYVGKAPHKIFRRRRNLSWEERQKDRERFQEKLCRGVSQEKLEELEEKLSDNPRKAARIARLRHLCEDADVEEDYDGKVHVTLEGSIRIDVVADGDTCDVTVQTDVGIFGSAEGETEGLYAILAASLVAKAICADEAVGTGEYLLRIYSEALVTSNDGDCYAEVVTEISTETAVVGDGLLGVVGGSVGIETGCDGPDGEKAVLMTEVVVQTVDLGGASIGSSTVDATVGYTGRKMLGLGRKL